MEIPPESQTESSTPTEQPPPPAPPDEAKQPEAKRPEEKLSEETPPEETVAAPDPVKRASRLRKQAESGTISDDDKAWLDNYERNKRKPGRPKKEEAKEETTQPEETKTSIPPPPPAPIIKSTARVKEKPPIVSESKKWREKYNGGVDDGRELLCRTIGAQWQKMLLGMAAELELAGLSPIVDVGGDAGLNLFICAVDDILPSYMKATPAILAAFQTTALTTQRLVKRNEIKKRLEAKQRVGTVVPLLRSEPTTEVKQATEAKPEAKKEEKREPRRGSGGFTVDGVWIDENTVR